MKKILLFLAICTFSLPLFSQGDTAKTGSDSPFGKAVHTTEDSLKKLPINDKLVGKWVLISSKSKKGHEDDMLPWNIQSIVFNADRTMEITPGPRFGNKMYWSYIQKEKDSRLVVFYIRKDSALTDIVNFAVLQVPDESNFKTTEWANIPVGGKHYTTLTFLKVE